MINSRVLCDLILQLPTAKRAERDNRPDRAGVPMVEKTLSIRDQRRNRSLASILDVGFRCM